VKFLISCWGDPSAWRETLYLFEDREYRSKSSTSVLSDHLKPDSILIIVLDSLIANYDCNFENYDDLKNSLEKELRTVIEDFGMDTEISRILIAPSVGSYTTRKGKMKITFLGNLSDFYNHVFSSLVDIFMRSVMEKESLEIHFDVTHGINFMPVLTYRILKEITGILALTKKVKFHVYNSDPYIKEGRLKIHIVEKKDVAPSFSAIHGNINSQLRNGKFLKLRDRHEKGEEFSRDRRSKTPMLEDMRKKSEIFAFISAVSNGFPLAIYSFFPEEEELRNNILNVIEMIGKYTSIHREKNEIVVERVINWDERFILFPSALLMVGILKGKNVGRKEVITLEELEKIRDIYHPISSINSLISRDLKEFEERKEEFDTSWKDLNEFDERVDIRTFLAHSGLAYGLIELKKDDGGALLMRYKPNRREKIAQLCINVCEVGE